MKYIKKISSISIFILIGFFSLFFNSSFTHNIKVLAQTPPPVIVETTGYSMINRSNYIFGGYYSGNFDKKDFTTYFEYKEDNENLDVGVEKTIEIDRETHLNWGPLSIGGFGGDFYTSQTLTKSLLSTYHFRAVGYFNDDPATLFKGNTITIPKGELPPGVIGYPFMVRSDDSAINFTSESFTSIQDLISGATENIITPACVFPETSFGGYCREASTIPATVRILANRVSIAYNEQSVITWYSTKAKSCDVRVSFIPDFDLKFFGSGTSGNNVTGALTRSQTYKITCVLEDNNTITKSVTVTVDDTGPGGTGATPDLGLVPCDNSAKNPCNFYAFLKLINTIIDYLFKYMVIPLAAVMFAYAGFLLVVSAGSTEKRSKAKSIFTNVAIGLVIALGAFVIIHTILGIVGATVGGRDGWNWFGFL